MNKTVSASQFCESVFDGTHDTPKPSKLGYPLITSKNIANGYLDISSAYLISEDDYCKVNKRSLVRQWDILFSMIGTVGDVYLERNPDIKYAIKNVGVFSCQDKEKAEWLYYYLKSPAAKKHIQRYLSGAVQKFLSLGALREFPVLPFDKVASNGIKQIALIDKKIELNNKINAELEAMAKLIYDYWFVQFDFPFDFAQGKPDANGRPYKSSGGKMVYNEALKREIPDGWDNGTLDDIGEIVGGSTPSTKKPENFADIGTPWITPNDLSKNVGNKFITRGDQDVSDVGVNSASLKLYPKNTVLLSSRAPIGYMAIAREPLTTNQGFKSFIPNKGFSSSFVFYAVRYSMKAIIQYSSGSTFKEVSGTVLKTVKVCLPPSDIVNSYTKAVESVIEKQNVLELENKQLSELRDWLLPMLMNGQVTVKD